VNISRIEVSGLSVPIVFTMPLTKELDYENPNKTLGCGYIDPTDQIMKSDGLSIDSIDNGTVRCMTTHLT